MRIAMTVLLVGWVAGAQEIVVTADKPSGVYAVGETARWHVEVKGADAKELTYALKKGGLTVTKGGTLALTNGAADLEASLDEPGSILAELKGKLGEKDVKGLGGAVFGPDKIQPSAPRPDDFDAFWEKKVADLHGIPANPQVEPADAGKPGVQYFKVTMDNVNGSHVYGQLARPAKEGKFPALLIVQWAGVYGLPKTNVTNRAEKGWLALNIMAHDLPFDRPEQFYKDAAAKELKDYMKIGDDDRERSYFLRMYLACYRAVDYLAERPDWDGKTLVVMGTSQGGQQTLVTAGMHPKVTAMLANVPAGCDVTGPRVGRAAGFPYWANYAKWDKNEKILETGRYFDATNFAVNIKCPALVALGLIDETCPPAGVLSAVDQMKGPKEVIVMPRSDHQGKGNAQAQFYARSEAWLRELVKGNPPPLR